MKNMDLICLLYFLSYEQLLNAQNQIFNIMSYIQLSNFLVIFSFLRAIITYTKLNI